MLKYVILASVMTVAAPAVAQTVPASPATQTAPTTAASDAMQTAPAAPATDPAQTAPADPAATSAAPAASGDQVAQVVNTEFPTYDKDSNGALSKTEFGSWMTALKSADPKAKKDATADRKWNDAAFAQADKDKSKSVSKDELTGFLGQAAKSS